MEFRVERMSFLQADNIIKVISHVDKLVKKEILKDQIKGNIELDISYVNKSNDECFKSVSFDFIIGLEEMNVIDFNLNKLDVYIVEGSGLNIEYVIDVKYDNEKIVEIIDLKEELKDALDDSINLSNELSDKIKEKIEIAKAKEDIHKEYEEKLLDSLEERGDVAVVVTKTDNSEIDFLSFFNNVEEEYYKIKTLECKNDDELNQISKDYKVNYQDLIKGYDKENGRVIFKIKE